MEGAPGDDRSEAAFVHRRDLGENQYDAHPAGAAVGAVPIAATAATNELTEADRQTMERLIRYRSKTALWEDLQARIEDAENKLPDVDPSEEEIRAAHEKRRLQIPRNHPGSYDASMLRACRELEQAHLGGRLPDSPGNNAEYWRLRSMQFQEDDPKIVSALGAFDENDREREANLVACKARIAHEAERERLGLDSLEAEQKRRLSDRGW